MRRFLPSSDVHGGTEPVAAPVLRVAEAPGRGVAADVEYSSVG
ncbi:MAG TPA: hypothetical protein VL068_03330 [Microthrixaceae bacterium]|nr:hypothetical protein [Microthrixaceae bacterium]